MAQIQVSAPDPPHLTTSEGRPSGAALRRATLGSLIFLSMGVCHALVTLVDSIVPTFLAPGDPGLIQQLTRAPIGLTARMSVWGGYIGFSWSHALGLAFFGGVYLAISRKAPQLFVEIRLLLPLAIGMAAAFCLIGVVYWFYAPAAASAAGGACFICAHLRLRLTRH